MSADAARESIEIDELISPDRPICYGVLKPGPFVEGGVPLVRIVDLESDKLSTDGLFRISPALDKEFARSRLEGGELLLSIQGTVGRVAVFPRGFGPANISRTIARLAFSDPSNAPFLRHWFRSKEGQRAIDGAIVGTTRSSLNIGVLRRLSVPHFNGIEKDYIIEILDTLDTAIHETEAIIAKLKAVKQGLLHDLLTRGIDANGELRPPQSEAPHLYKPSPLGWIPKEWGTPTFAELQSQPILGLAVRGAATDGRNVGLVKMGNLCENNELDLTSVEGLAISRVKNIDKFLLEDGDLLFNTRNTPELVGKTCSWHGTLEPYVFDNNILRARIPRRIGSGHYFAHYLGSEIGRRSLLRLATGTTSVAAIYWKDLGSLKVPAPPTAEQAAIHEMIKSVEVKRSFVERGLQILRQMKAGLMDDLLTGRVRVTPLLQEAQQA